MCVGGECEALQRGFGEKAFIAREQENEGQILGEQGNKSITVEQGTQDNKEALAIRRIFSLVDIITKAKFSISPNDFKIRLFG